MADASEHLRSIDEQLNNGVVPARESVRTFLSWFGATRRGNNVVQRIRSELQKFNLETQPDFQTAYIDEEIRFVRPGEYRDGSGDTIDPIYRVRRLESAHRKPLHVQPESPLTTATTLMLNHDYSQLPVQTTDREVKGVVTWRSIGTRLALGSVGSQVHEFMVEPQIVSLDTSLFDVINLVSRYQYVLVRGTDKSICGIVTATDLTQQFRYLAEPFLLLGEIENHIRILIHGRFSAEELREVRAESDPTRSVEAITDLTFGEYRRLIESESNWSRLDLRIDRVHFIKQLEQVRLIRNDVMHFDPEGLSDEDITTLREFAEFLRALRRAGAF